MHRYAASDSFDDLDPWPMDSPASAYVITAGTPQTSGRFDAGGPGHTTRQGIWRCTAGTFECTEQGDELMTVLSGHCTITDHATGQATKLGPGDSCFLRGGSRVTWDIHADLTKVFYAHKPDGF